MTNQTNSVFSLLKDNALVHHSSYIAGQFQSGRNGHFASRVRNYTREQVSL